MADGNRSAERRAEGKRFFRFCVVGAAGFLADAGCLVALADRWGFDPLAARAASFSVAVSLTFCLNRGWSFADSPRRGVGVDFPAYLGVQGFGLACNLSVYAAALRLAPAPWNAPLFCLVLASAVALTVNYAGARRLAFRVGGGRASA